MKKMRRVQKRYQRAICVGFVIGIGLGGILSAGFGIASYVLKHQKQETVEVVNRNVIQGTVSPIENQSEKTLEETLAPTKEPEKIATLTFTGDLMVHDYQYKSCYDAATKTYDFSGNFPEVTKYLETADYTIGNLETVLGGAQIGITSYPCFNSPDSFADAIKDAGYDLLTTANNHCVDRGVSAMERTITQLNKMKFDHIGTYKTEKARNKIFVKKIQGIKIAFLSCTYGTNGISFGESYHVNLLNEQFYEDIKRADQKADFVIVLPHNGTEYQVTPAVNYQQQYKKMLECGADAVIASHPHILQPMEYKKVKDADGKKRKCFVAYSLGNFISSQRTVPRDAGVILTLTVKKKGKHTAIKSVDVIPTWVRMKDTRGKNNFKVFSVYDILNYDQKKRKEVISTKDFNRVLQVQTQSTKTLLGTSYSVEDAKESYSFPVEKKNFNLVSK